MRICCMASATCNGYCSRLPHSKTASKKANYLTHNFCPSCGLRGLWFPKEIYNKNNAGALICVCCKARLRTGERGSGHALKYNMTARDVFRENK